MTTKVVMTTVCAACDITSQLSLFKTLQREELEDSDCGEDVEDWKK